GVLISRGYGRCVAFPPMYEMRMAVAQTSRSTLTFHCWKDASIRLGLNATTLCAGGAPGPDGKGRGNMNDGTVVFTKVSVTANGPPVFSRPSSVPAPPP